MSRNDSQKQAATNRTIGRYEVVRCLGRGSQGSVFLGIDPNLERQVAIKVLSLNDDLRVQVDQDQPSLEGRIASRIRHPNIISVFDAGVSRGRPYLVFEYVPGQTLSELLKSDGPLQMDEARAMIRPLVDAMAMAHAKEILHLDLSPRNILVDRDGIPRIMDFGLSQFTNHVASREGFAIGTLRYMSPEHVCGESLGPYSDVFALGCTFYEMVIGKAAFDGQITREIMLKIRDANVDLQPVFELPHGKAFSQFLKGALVRDYRARYADGAALKNAFERLEKDAGMDMTNNAAASDRHSTVDFLLRRMRRKQDFPTMSRTFIDINRLTSGDTGVSADQLANVILRDYALTSKLLKLVNSAYYRGIGGEVTTISHAIVILGINQLRMSASGLTYMGQMKGAGCELRDSVTQSLLSGLIARNLAKRAGLKDSEEAFICGLFQNLGEILVIYYFPEEHREITELLASASTGKYSASQAVLGIGFDELGAAVARTWKLPEEIVRSILGRETNELYETENETVRIGHFAVFANELCAIANAAKVADRNAALRCLIDDLGGRLKVSEEYALKLLSAGMQKLREHAHIFEIDVKRSGFCDAVNAWINSEQASAPDHSCVDGTP